MMGSWARHISGNTRFFKSTHSYSTRTLTNSQFLWREKFFFVQMCKEMRKIVAHGSWPAMMQHWPGVYVSNMIAANIQREANCSLAAESYLLGGIRGRLSEKWWVPESAERFVSALQGVTSFVSTQLRSSQTERLVKTGTLLVELRSALCSPHWIILRGVKFLSWNRRWLRAEVEFQPPIRKQ